MANLDKGISNVSQNNETFAEGDTFIIHNVLPDDLASVAFDELKKEVKWNVMYHRGNEAHCLLCLLLSNIDPLCYLP